MVNQNSRECAEIVFMARKDKNSVQEVFIYNGHSFTRIYIENSRKRAKYQLIQCVRKQQNNMLEIVYGQSK